MMIRGFLLTFSMAAALVGSPERAIAFDINCPLERSLRKQVQGLSCDLRDIAQRINSGKETVPKTIYHFGKEEYLRHHAEKGTITQDRWDDFIMGGKSRYKLAANRRGLYGTAGLDTNHFAKGDHTWLMEIHIKDECRKPENVVTFFGLPDSQRFKSWFEKLPESERAYKAISDFKSMCFIDGAPNDNYRGTFEGDEQCGSFIDKYLVQSNAKVVQDHAIKKSFYLRDRSCIETIKGSPKDVIELAANRRLLWLAPCEKDGSRGVLAMMDSLNQALISHEGTVPDNVLTKIAGNLRAAGLPPEGVKAFRRCQKAGTKDKFKDLVETAGVVYLSPAFGSNNNAEYAQTFNRACTPQSTEKRE